MNEKKGIGRGVLLRQSVYGLMALVVLFLVSGYSTTHAQLVNGDFESACTGASIHAHAFQVPYRCVTGPWFVSHGSPDIGYNLIGGNTTHYARMWSYPLGENKGEGLFVDCPTFISGRTYRVRLSLSREQSMAACDFFIVLANGLQHQTTSSSYPLPTPSSSMVAHTELDLPSGTWRDIVFTVTPTSNFQQLWFYPVSKSSHSVYGAAVAYMDSVVVTEISCPAAAVYSSFSGSPAVTEVEDYIQASGTSAVTGAQTVTFKAGNYVRLQPNFRATPISGSFYAYIAPCSLEQPIQPCTDNVLGPIPKHGVGESQEIGDAGFLPAMGEELLTNYPNPFTGKTAIQYRVNEPAPVTLAVVNMLGERVATLVQDELRSVGTYSLEFDATSLPRGMYYMVLHSGTITVTKKLVVVP